MALQSQQSVPKDGVAGLKENFNNDLLSGFMVSLVALPLSLGVAKASGFPNPMYGVLTSIIGGILVSLVAGSRLTVKGPAAGLIVILAGAIAEFGGGSLGWKLTLGAIVAAGLLQILFGIFKLDRFVNFFPLPVAHGMLAAIGLILISKQIHVLIGMNPMGEDGKPLIEPLALLRALPQSISSIQYKIPIVITGISCLLIIFFLPLISSKFYNKIPVPMVVLFVSIPIGSFLGLQHIEGGLIRFNQSFTDIIGWHVDFGGLTHLWIFLKYVILFALIGTLESLLVVHTLDTLDPYQRKSDAGKELRALGAGNVMAGFLGGLPMISEVARSAANISYGAKTRWANFFHGVFLLIFMLILTPFIEMIPTAALAALLIGIGYKLAHPKEFIHFFRIGKAALFIFLVTIIVTLAVDLLVGVFSGAILNMIIHVYKGKPIRELFIQETNGEN